MCRVHGLRRRTRSASRREGPAQWSALRHDTRSRSAADRLAGRHAGVEGARFRKVAGEVASCRRRRRERAPGRTQTARCTSRSPAFGGGAFPSRPSTCRGRCIRLAPDRRGEPSGGSPSARRTRRWPRATRPPSRSTARSMQVWSKSHQSASQHAVRRPERPRGGRDPRLVSPRKIRGVHDSTQRVVRVRRELVTMMQIGKGRR